MEKADGPLALKELSARADLDPSGAHRYLASFVRCGLVTQLPDSRYDMGPSPSGWAWLRCSAATRSRPPSAPCRRSWRKPATPRFSPCEQPRTDHRALAAHRESRHLSQPRLGAAGGAFVDRPHADGLSAGGRDGGGPGHEARREKIDREWLARERSARKTRLAYADKTVIPGLYAAASVVLGWNGDAVAAIALIGPDAELGRQNNPAALALRGCATGSRARPARRT